MKKRLERALAALAVLAAAVMVSAGASADTIVQSFSSTDALKPGFVAAVVPGTTTKVELSPANQSQLMYGVVIDPSQAPVTLQRQTGQQIFVATSGNYPILVSTANGAIKPGDYLSISNTDGIAARANTSQALIVGQATQKFDGSSGTISGTGSNAIGKISANVLVQRNPWLKQNVALPSFLRSAGDSIAGKEVAAVRIYAALGLFLVTAIIAFGALSTGIRSSMTAIGRNPLSRRFILNGLVQVVVVSIVVLSLGMIGVYLLLKL